MHVQTPLGTVKFEMKADDASAVEAEFFLLRPQIPAALTGRVEALWTGVWRVRVTGEAGRLTFSCAWEPGYAWRSGGASSGEHLDAQTFENEKWQASIGTEDEEALGLRAERGDGLPKHVQIGHAVYRAEGLTVPLGGLRAGDVCRMHISVAWAKRSEDVGDWLAVDRSVTDDELGS